MEFRFRAIDEQGSNYIPPPSSMTYFTEQAIRAGYSGPNFGPTSEFFRNPSNMQEAIHRELEKERIREEIIASEIARKRLLEAEVRREMMLERKMALCGTEGFSLLSGPLTGSAMLFEPRLSLLHQSEGRSLEERLALSLEQRLGAHRGIGGFEAPFQRNAEPKITEIKSPSEVSKEKEKEKVIFLAKPEANISGAKRKAVTPPAAGTIELRSVGSKKKSKEEWSCAICQVSATSEHGLDEHLRGRKHKSREAGLRAQKTGKNYAIGLFPKKAKPADNQNSEVENRNDLGLKIQYADDSKIQDGDQLQKMERNGDDKKNRFKFWCDMCQVGVFSEKVMNKHRKGKKHMGRLLGFDQYGDGSVRAAQVEEAPKQEESDPEVIAQEEKEEEAPENVEDAGEGEALENHEMAVEVAGGVTD